MQVAGIISYKAADTNRGKWLIVLIFKFDLQQVVANREGKILLNARTITSRRLQLGSVLQ
jgi:hypothetical protein